MKNDNQYKNILFIGSARCYHTMDWYRSAKIICQKRNVIIVTDSIESEKYLKIANDGDEIISLLNIDRFLFNAQSNIGNIWRNILKAILLPLQLLLLRRIVRRYKPIIIHAHAMYYMWLCWAARIQFIGTPQGSEILVRPKKSKIYRYFAQRTLKSAKRITVDSIAMKNEINRMADVEAYIIQNGIDMDNIQKVDKCSLRSREVTSIRAITPLYRIHEIIKAREESTNKPDITFIYPFCEDNYKRETFKYINEKDSDLGRINRNDLYKVLNQTVLALSIPISDSSPRSVYEAIICGCCVAVTSAPWTECLPECMKNRIIVININECNWLDKAIDQAYKIIKQPFIISKNAKTMFDQRESMKIMAEQIYQI